MNIKASMANEEDFGMVMAESLAGGTPVIAYGRGGALEIVNDCHPDAGRDPVTCSNGVLFHEPTVDSLIAAVRKFQTLTFDPAVLRNSSQKFSEENFEKGIEAAVIRADVIEPAR